MPSLIDQFICHYLFLLTANCPPGTYQTTRVDTRLSAVDSQSRIVVPQCTECPVGYYQSDQGQITCDICPPGSTSITQGSRSCILLCAPHYYSSTGFEPCTPCPEGSYALANGSTTCSNCNTSSTDVPTSICPIISTAVSTIVSTIVSTAVSTTSELTCCTYRALIINHVGLITYSLYQIYYKYIICT